MKKLIVLLAALFVAFAIPAFAQKKAAIPSRRRAYSRSWPGCLQGNAGSGSAVDRRYDDRPGHPTLLTSKPRVTTGSATIPGAMIPTIISIKPWEHGHFTGGIRPGPCLAACRRRSQPLLVRRLLLQRRPVRRRLLQRLALGFRPDHDLRRSRPRGLVSGLQRPAGDVRSRDVPRSLARRLAGSFLRAAPQSGTLGFDKLRGRSMRDSWMSRRYWFGFGGPGSAFARLGQGHRS